jgi:site-specific DNA-cytosine methylase
MKVLELFCGTKSIGKVFKAGGHQVFSIDIDSSFNPDLTMDITKLKKEDLPLEFQTPDIVWASPPCTVFSVASISRYWVNGKPKNDKTLEGIAIVKKTISLIEELKPKYFFIENPRGMLRKLEVVLATKKLNEVAGGVHKT